MRGRLPIILALSPLRVAMHPHSMRTRRSWRLWRSSSVSRRFHLARAMSPRGVRLCPENTADSPRTGTRTHEPPKARSPSKSDDSSLTDSSRIRSVGSHHSIHHPSHHSIHHPSHHRKQPSSQLPGGGGAGSSHELSAAAQEAEARAQAAAVSANAAAAASPCADRPSRRSTRS